MVKKYGKIYLVMVHRIFTVISCILIISSLGLEIASRKSMGVYRDLVFRKGILENTILGSDLLNIYKWLTMIGIGVCIIIIFSKRNSIISRAKKYIWTTISFSIVFVIMIIFYNKISWIAYPLMLVSIGITVIFQYIVIVWDHK